MGAVGPTPYAQRALLAVAAAVVIAMPLPGLRASAASDGAEPDQRAETRLQPNDVQDPDHPKADRFTDTAALFQALGGGWWHRPDLSSVANAR